MTAIRLFMFSALLLSACVETTGQPSAALQKLQAQCSNGDTEACKTVVEIEQRERERLTEIWVGDDDVLIFN